jgi:hypothetical protein
MATGGVASSERRVFAARKYDRGEFPVRAMKNLVPFSKNLWGDRWGKGKEESGTKIVTIF